MKARIVIDVLKPVAAGGALETVRRLCQRINEVMVYSINIGLITTNPLAGIREAFITPTAKAMPSLKPNQLAKLMKDLSLANIRKVTRSLIEWQLHTMVRPGEAACAETAHKRV
jgi:hypothetical protein